MTKEAFENNEILNIEWIGSKNNIADGLTKLSKYKSLEKFHDGIIYFFIKQEI